MSLICLICLCNHSHFTEDIVSTSTHKHLSTNSKVAKSKVGSGPGTPLLYNQESLTNPNFVAYGKVYLRNDTCQSFVLSAISRTYPTTCDSDTFARLLSQSKRCGQQC